MTLPATDTFTNTNGTTLPTHNAGWSNATSGMEIRTNRANGITGDNTPNMARWSGDTFAAAHYSKGTYAGTATASNGPGPAVRCQSGAVSFFQAFCDSTTCYPGQTIAGSSSDWDSGQTVAINDVIELRIDATTTTTVRLYKNDTLIATYTGKNALSGGSAGVSMFNADDSVGIDNWEGGDVSAAGKSLVHRSSYFDALLVR